MVLLGSTFLICWVSLVVTKIIQEEYKKKKLIQVRRIFSTLRRNKTESYEIQKSKQCSCSFPSNHAKPICNAINHHPSSIINQSIINHPWSNQWTDGWTWTMTTDRQTTTTTDGHSCRGLPFGDGLIIVLILCDGLGLSISITQFKQTFNSILVSGLYILGASVFVFYYIYICKKGRMYLLKM